MKKIIFLICLVIITLQSCTIGYYPVGPSYRPHVYRPYQPYRYNYYKPYNSYNYYNNNWQGGGCQGGHYNYGPRR